MGDTASESRFFWRASGTVQLDSANGVIILAVGGKNSLLVRCLTARMPAIATASSPRAACDRFVERRFDLVLADVTGHGSRMIDWLVRLAQEAERQGSMVVAFHPPEALDHASVLKEHGVPALELPGNPEALDRLLAMVESRAFLARKRRVAEFRATFLERCLDAVPFGLTITDQGGSILFANGPEATMHGYEVTDLLGRNARILAPEPGPVPGGGPAPEDLPSWRREGMRDWRRRSINIRRDGSTFPVILTSKAVAAKGQPLAIVTTSEDDSDRSRRAELADTRDRAVLLSHIEKGLNRLREGDGLPFALLYLDIDHFRSINYSRGHQAADRLLLEFNDRLQAVAERVAQPGQRCLTAHVGGDEFVLLVEPVANEREAARLADLVHSGLADPFIVEEGESLVTACIGVVLASHDHQRPEEVLGDGNTAAASAKRRGKAGTALFDSRMRADQRRNAKLEQELQHAVQNGQFRLVYQPILGVKNGTLRGMEALIRWAQPDGTLASPDTFIEVAEESGLIVQMGRWAVEEACRQIRIWQAAIGRPLGIPVSVNVSGVEFNRPDLITQIDRSLRKHGLYGRSLRLELTESTLMARADDAAAMLHQLRTLGIELAIDDFGTGYSSLAYLQRFEIDCIKIDRSFIHNLHRDPGKKQIVATIIALATALEKSVVAEGVELWSELELLRELGCDAAQGFYFSQPLTSDAMQNLLREPAPTAVS